MSTSKNKLSVQTLVRCAMIAAVYTVLCLVLQPFSYGAVQVRVAEAFCLLPVFGAEYIVGVTLGCLLANLLGSTMVDVVFGTAATLIACLATYALRNVRWKGLAINELREDGTIAEISEKYFGTDLSQAPSAN